MGELPFNPDQRDENDWLRQADLRSDSNKKNPVFIHPDLIPQEKIIKTILEDAGMTTSDFEKIMRHIGIPENIVGLIRMTWDWSFSRVPNGGNMWDALHRTLLYIHEKNGEDLFGPVKRTESGRLQSPNAVMQDMRNAVGKLGKSRGEDSLNPPSGSFKLPEKPLSIRGVDTHSDRDALKLSELKAHLQDISNQKPSLPSSDDVIATLDKTVQRMKDATQSSVLNLKEVNIDPSVVPDFDE